MENRFVINGKIDKWCKSFIEDTCTVNINYKLGILTITCLIDLSVSDRADLLDESKCDYKTYSNLDRLRIMITKYCKETFNLNFNDMLIELDINLLDGNKTIPLLSLSHFDENLDTEVTFDHRYFTGVKIAKLVKRINTNDKGSEYSVSGDSAFRLSGANRCRDYDDIRAGILNAINTGVSRYNPAKELDIRIDDLHISFYNSIPGLILNSQYNAVGYEYYQDDNCILLDVDDNRTNRRHIMDASKHSNLLRGFLMFTRARYPRFGVEDTSVILEHDGNRLLEIFRDWSRHE